MSLLETILLAFGGQAILLTAVCLLARGLFQHWLGKDLELYKAEVQNKNELTREQLRHELGLLAKEHALRATELQARRAEVIADIYGLLADVEWESRLYVSQVDLTGQTKSEAQQALVSKKVDIFYRYFNRHRIYLPADTCETVWRLMSGMVVATNKIKAHLEDSGRDHGRLTEDQLSAFIAANDYFNKHHEDARKELEEDLRGIMGDKCESKA